MEEADYPWFTSVEIEVNGRCNRRCRYCPVSVVTPPAERLMSDHIFERTLSELIRIGFNGCVSYHLFNEPLLRRDLENLVSRVRQGLPAAYQMLFTNGDYLTDERYMSLRQAGIDHFIVTRHDYSPIPARAAQTIQFPSDLVIVNRGGFLKTINESLEVPCFAPSEKLTIGVDGEVLLCCNDSERTQRMGNIAHQSLEEIWFSEEFVRIRHLLQQGRRKDASPLCRECDDREYFGPGENRHLKPST